MLNKNFLTQNIFLIALIFWILIILLINKYLDVNINILILASIFPILNLLYNHLNIKKNDNYLLESKKLYWLSDRLHTNSLYIATGVFAVNGVTQKIIGERYKKIMPYYLITIFLCVCVNLILFNSSNRDEKIIITHFKQIFLTYGIALMSIGILKTIYIIRN